MLYLFGDLFELHTYMSSKIVLSGKMFIKARTAHLQISQYFQNLLWNIAKCLEENYIVFVLLQDLLTSVTVPTHHRSSVCAIRMRR